MLLVSYGFAAFVLAALILYYGLPGRFQQPVLLVFSVLFYLAAGPVYILYPVFTALTTWRLAKRIGDMTAFSKAWVKENHPDREEKKAHNQAVRKKQRHLLLTGILLNFGILAVLKYTNFLLGNVEILLHLAGIEGEMEYADWLLPLGISYYTFQSMGYLADVYWRRYEPERSPARFFLFVCYFPQLTAGPINRFDALGKQFLEEHRLQPERLRLGAERILWGYFKKLVVADRLGPAAQAITDQPELYGGFYVLAGIVFQVIRLYADFSGGMDIVLGVSELFGIRLAENFEQPFFSKNLAEFWRRWHISLMQWFREYIFFPVSTSHAGKCLSGAVRKHLGKQAAGKAPVYLATLTVWLVTGIWHGASWGWIFWGLTNGVILLISQELDGIARKRNSRLTLGSGKAADIVRMLRTFLLLCFTWLFVYYPISMIPGILADIFTGKELSDFFGGGLLELLDGYDLLILAVGIFLMAAADLLGQKESVRIRLSRAPLFLHFAAVFFLLLTVLIAGVYGQGYDSAQFIYNRF